jgi:hypothetical protein
MKVGILTFHAELNCGAVLQAYALQQKLLELGFEAEFIDYRLPNNFSLRSFIGRNIPQTIDKWIKFFQWLYFRKSFNEILIINGRKYKNTTSLKKITPKYDIYIVGSDQVWNFDNKINSTFLFDFLTDDKIRFSYGASLGQCNISPESVYKISLYLSKFRSISVRENEAKDFLENILNRPISLVCDPTLLISKSYFDKLLVNKMIDLNYTNYISVYILNLINYDIDIYLKIVRKTINAKMVNLCNPGYNIKFKDVFNKIINPAEFIYYIKNSKFVICSSLHAVIFSIIYHIPFIVLLPKLNNKENYRLKSLLEPIGLYKRCIYDKMDETKFTELLNEEILWDDIDIELQKTKNKSVSFLIENLKI